MAPVRPPAPRNRLLQWWAGGATAAALALGAYALVLSRPLPAPLMAVMVSDRAQSAWAATVGADGVIRLAATALLAGEAAPLPVDPVMQLWALPPGATVPTGLALLDRGQRRVAVAAPPVRPVAGMLIEITLEPPGGSPTGRPTGPVLFIGHLNQPGPDS